MAVFLETSLAGAECVAVALRCGKLLDSLRSIPACHGLGIARACVEDHFPEPERFGRITALFSQDGEVSQGQMAVDTLIDATELVGTLESQDPPPAGFGLGRLARLAMQDRLAEMQLVVVGVDPGPRNTRREPLEEGTDQSWRSTAIAPQIVEVRRVFDDAPPRQTGHWSWARVPRGREWVEISERFPAPSLPWASLSRENSKSV